MISSHHKFILLAAVMFTFQACIFKDKAVLTKTESGKGFAPTEKSKEKFPLRDASKLKNAKRSKQYHRVESAKVAWVDYKLLYQDFPELRRSFGDWQEETVQKKVNLWLLNEFAYLSQYQVKQTDVNAPIHLSLNTKNYRDAAKELRKIAPASFKLNDLTGYVFQEKSKEDLIQSSKYTERLLALNSEDFLQQSNSELFGTGWNASAERIKNPFKNQLLIKREGIIPETYERAVVFEARHPTREGKVMGLIDVKGSGMSSRLPNFKAVKRDGLMSLGEAIRETVVQRAVHKSLARHAKKQKQAGKKFNFSTVQNYAVIDLGFDKKWKQSKWETDNFTPCNYGGDCDRAGLVLRQSHRREEFRKVININGLPELKEAYLAFGLVSDLNHLDNELKPERAYDGPQIADGGRIYDFGTIGVRKCDTELCLPFETWGHSGRANPRGDYPWVFAHETARAFVAARGKAARSIVQNHINTMEDTIGYLDLVTMVMRFRSETKFGESIYVYGSLPELGSWDVNQAIALSPDTYPVWEARIRVPKKTNFEFKFLWKNQQGELFPEQRKNRKARTPIRVEDVVNVQ